MSKDTALRLALEALKNSWTEPNNEQYEIEKEAIVAIKAALEAKDEPVAWMYEVNHAHTCLDLFEPPDDAYDEGTLYPLYTHPSQQEAKDEAVAWIWMPTGEVTTDPDRADGMWEPLFLAPPQRKPLTDEEIERIYHRYGGDMINCARAIERAHGIKGETK